MLNKQVVVLESLLTGKLAEARPQNDFVVAATITSVSLFVAYFLFPAFASMVAIVLVSLATVPILMSVFRLEEERDDIEARGPIHHSLFGLHRNALRFFLVFFVSISLTVAFWNSVLPQTVKTTLFETQTKEIRIITGAVSGNFLSDAPQFNPILFNNLQVLSSTFLLSLIFGGGAAFILTWNASIFGVFISELLAKEGPFVTPMVFGYAVPELVAYYIAGMAGGIMSMGVIKFGRHKDFLLVLMDTAVLMALAAGIIVVSALVEAKIMSG